jgi:hypothetical protein
MVLAVCLEIVSGRQDARLGQLHMYTSVVNPVTDRMATTMADLQHKWGTSTVYAAAVSSIVAGATTIWVAHSVGGLRLAALAVGASLWIYAIMVASGPVCMFVLPIYAVQQTMAAGYGYLSVGVVAFIAINVGCMVGGMIMAVYARAAMAAL